jgi:hypothetical protein
MRALERIVSSWRSCRFLPGWLLLLAAQVVVCAETAAATSGDDFNDNSRDPLKWGTDSVIGTGAMSERSQHLEYTCTSTVSEAFIVRPWVLTRLPYSADWEVQIDLANTSSPAGTSQVNSFGLRIISPFTADNVLDVEMYNSSLLGGPGRAGFFALLEAGSTVGSVDTGAAGDTAHGAVRMAFVGATKVVTVFYDDDLSNGYQWVPFGSFGLAGAGGADGNTDWGLGETDQFPVYVYGYSASMAINAGLVFGDNFVETGGVTPTGGPSPDPIGNFRFSFPSNPLLTAIFNLTGNYRGNYRHKTAPAGDVPPLPYKREYTIDAAQDESGKLALMATMDGVVDSTGSPEIQGGAGAVSTVNATPTAEVKLDFAGTVDGATAEGSAATTGPIEIVDVRGGRPGIAPTSSYTGKVAGVPLTLSNQLTPTTLNPANLANLRNDWAFVLDVHRTVVKGEEMTVASAQLVLPGGDTIAFAEKVVRYSPSRGYSLSFKRGINITANPPRPDRKCAITIRGLTLAPQGSGWLPTGGTISYQFLGQKGKADLLGFITP